MADKLILNAGVNGMSDFERLGKSLKNIKTSATGSLGTLSKKMTESVGKSTKLSSTISALKTKLASIKNSNPFQKIGAGLGSMKGQLDGVKGRIGGLKGAFGGLKGMIMGAVAAAGLLAFASSSISAYKDSIEASTKLQANLSTVKSYGGDPKVMKENLGLMQAQSQAMMQTGVYDDDLITAGQAQLSTFQLTGKEINTLMPKMTDLVANEKGMGATAGDFYAKANMIGKAISTGQLAPLRKVGIALSEQEEAQFKTANQTQKVAMMNKILEANVGKVNEELAKTDLGRIQQGTNLWGNMQETVGQGLVQILGSLAPALYPLIDVIGSASTAFSSGMVSAINAVKPILDSIGKSFQKAGGMEKLQGIGASLKGLFTDIGSSVGALFKGVDIGALLSNVVGGIKAVIDGIKGAFEFIKPVLDPILTMIGKIVQFLSPAIPIIMQIITVFTIVIEVVSGIISAIMAIGPIVAGISALIAFIASPLGIIIAIITAIILIFINWKTISTFVINMIKVGLAGIGQFFTMLGTTIMGVANAMWNGIMVGINAIGAFFGFVFNGFVLVAQAVWSGIMAGISFLVAYFQAEWNILVFISQFVWNMILAGINFVINGIKAYINGIIFVATFVFNLVKGIIVGAFNSAKSTVVGVIDGIKSAIGGIVNKVNEIVTAVKNAFNPANWKVPSIKFPFMGKNYMGTENWKGGLTTVAERGAELIQTPGGSPFIANKEMAMNLPKGTVIKNARDTQAMQNFKPNPLQEMKNKYLGSQTTNSNTTTNNTNKSTDNDTSNNSSITMIVQNMSDIKNIEKVLMEVLERVNKKNRLSNLLGSGEIS